MKLSMYLNVFPSTSIISVMLEQPKQKPLIYDNWGFCKSHGAYSQDLLEKGTIECYSMCQELLLKDI